MTERPLPARVTLVLGAAAGGMGAHVQMLAAGLAAQATAVTVAGPPAAAARFSFSALPKVSFSPVEISGRPRPADLRAILRLRRLLLHPGGAVPHAVPPGGRPVVHAHGLRAGALTALACLLVGTSRSPGFVVTVHNAPPAGGAARLVYRVLERVTARRADLVLCVSPDLEHRMRAAGARRVDRAVIAAPGPSPGPVAARADAPPSSAAPGRAAPASAGGPGTAADPAVAPEGRPVVLAAGRLAAQKDFGVLLEAAAAWRDLDPPPLLVIAGDGPLAGELRARAAALGVAASFPGHRDDVPALLARAAVFVLPSRWEGQPLVLQEALRAGTPAVATRVGGVPGLAGDAALLVPPGDARALADAVRRVLTDAPLAARLRAAAAVRAAALPTEADAVAAALDAYSSVPRGARLR